MNHTTTAPTPQLRPGLAIERTLHTVWGKLRRFARLPRSVIREIDTWGIAWLTWTPGKIGNAIRIRYLRRHCEVGSSCQLAPGFRVHHPAGLELGSRVAANGAQINAKGGVRIGSDCLIADGVKIWSINHLFTDREQTIADQGYEEAPVVIGDDVWLGSNAVILPGVTIGRGAVVAAGAIVTRDVPSWAIAAGVPARVVGVRGGVDTARSHPGGGEAC